MKKDLQAIKRYQKKLGYDYDNMSHHMRMVSFRDNVAALIAELGELMQEVPWKPWKKTANQEDNILAALDEHADCFFFLANLGLSLGFTPELMDDAFNKKLQVNLQRIENGYNNTKEERTENGIDDKPLIQQTGKTV